MRTIQPRRDYNRGMDPDNPDDKHIPGADPTVPEPVDYRAGTDPDAVVLEEVDPSDVEEPVEDEPESTPTKKKKNRRSRHGNYKR